jgi:hypothetical protein
LAALGGIARNPQRPDASFDRSILMNRASSREFTAEDPSSAQINTARITWLAREAWAKSAPELTTSASAV